MTKPLIKSKTFWVNTLVVAAAVITAVVDCSVISSNPEYVAFFGAALGFVNIILRTITKDAIE